MLDNTVYVACMVNGLLVLYGYQVTVVVDVL